MEKITKARNDKAARENAVKELNLGGLSKVSNTEYALEVKDLEDNSKVVIVKLTVPKKQVKIEDLVNAYQAELAEKEAKKLEKKAKKLEKSKEKAQTVEF